MSVRMMTLVWELDLPDSEKLVLLSLADCANDEGHCWPGMTALMKKCSKSDRTIQLAIRTLCTKGHLTRREVLGKGCNYTVHPIVRLGGELGESRAAPALAEQAATAAVFGQKLCRNRKIATPETLSPRRDFAPKGTTPTPEAASGKPSRTINTEAKASLGRIIDRWNERSKTSGIPPVRVLNHSRTQMGLARLKEHGEVAMLEAVDKVHDSAFCRGLRGDGRKADIMLILQPKTLPRALEGFYNQDSDLKHKYVSVSGHEYRGDEDQVMREAERRADWSTYWAASANRKSRAA